MNNLRKIMLLFYCYLCTDLSFYCEKILHVSIVTEHDGCITMNILILLGMCVNNSKRPTEYVFAWDLTSDISLINYVCNNKPLPLILLSKNSISYYKFGKSKSGKFCGPFNQLLQINLRKEFKH